MELDVRRWPTNIGGKEFEMEATSFFDGIGILAKYGGDRLPKKNGDPVGRLRMSTTGVSEPDAQKLREIGYQQDAAGLWYCDT